MKQYNAIHIVLDSNDTICDRLKYHRRHIHNAIYDFDSHTSSGIISHYLRLFIDSIYSLPESLSVFVCASFPQRGDRGTTGDWT